MMTAAQLGLEPNTPLGQAYLLPYWNSKANAYECQFQLGYKGLLDLAYRSGEISVIQAHVVYSEDQFSYSFGLKPELKHIPASGERGEPVYVYAIFHTKDGGYGFEVCSITASGLTPSGTANLSKTAPGRPILRRWQRKPS